jgi:hypothetical protein
MNAGNGLRRAAHVTGWLLLLVAVVVLPIAGRGSTVGPDGEERVTSTISVADLVVTLGPDVLAIVVLGALATVVGDGWRGLGGALAALLGAERDDAAALRGLTTWSRAATSAGFVLGLVGFLALIFLGRVASEAELPSPVDVASCLTTTIFAPAVGVLFGRLWLGSYADAVRRRRGESTPTFDAGVDLGLLGLLLPSLIAFVFVFTPWNG